MRDKTFPSFSDIKGPLEQVRPYKNLQFLVASYHFQNTVFKFISKHLIINWLSTRNHPDNWLPWINPTRTTDRAGLQKPSSKRRGRK